MSTSQLDPANVLFYARSRSISLKPIFWANYSSGSTIQHMRVNHCCPDVGVAQQFLDCAYVIASLHHCHTHSCAAEAYFLARASGSNTLPHPSDRSFAWMLFTIFRCCWRGSTSLPGSTVLLSLFPFPALTVTSRLSKSRSLTLISSSLAPLPALPGARRHRPGLHQYRQLPVAGRPPGSARGCCRWRSAPRLCPP